MLTVVDFLDEHAGAVTATATVTLALVTFVYVLLTRRLVAAQQSGERRDIAEKLYAPLLTQVEEVRSGHHPGGIAGAWRQLLKNEPYLCFHQAFDSSVRRVLEKTVEDASEQQDRYWEIRRWAGLHCATRYFPSEAIGDGFYVDVSFVAGYLTSVGSHQFLIAHLSGLGGAQSLIGAFQIAGATKLELELLSPHRSITKAVPTDVDTVRELIEELVAAAPADSAAKPVLRDYGEFLIRLSRLERRLRKGLASASRL